MATVYSSNAAGVRPALTRADAGCVGINHGVFSLTAALIVNDTIRICKLPAGEVPVDFILGSDDLDSGGSPAIVLKVGIEDTVGDTSDDDALILGSTVAQAGGIARMDAVAGRRLAPVQYDRYITIKVSTAPATGATSGVISGTLMTRAKGFDD